MTAQKGKDLLLKVDTNGAVTVASNIPSTPSGDIAATNVDAAIAELAGEKAPKASPTFTGLVTAPALVSGGPVSIADDGVADLGAIATSVRVMLVMMSGGAGNIGWYRIGGGLGIVFLDGTIAQHQHVERERNDRDNDRLCRRQHQNRGQGGEQSDGLLCPARWRSLLRKRK
ncbi:MAG TPA: hypothetical protein VFQ31_05305 [Methyloceanibacter sp.]|nr:hypothetical protein [Methyloceanibacter sp.]